jgi:hypothetical protein
MSVSCECCVLSGRGLCVGLITCPEESYRAGLRYWGPAPLGAVASLGERGNGAQGS